MVEADKPTTTAPERVSERLQGGGCIYAGLGSMPEQGQAGTPRCSPSRDRRLNLSRTPLSCGGGRQVVVLGLGVSP